MKELDLLEISRKAIDIALKEGAEQVDVYASDARIFSIDIEKSGIKSVDVVRDRGIGIRAYVKGGLGFSSTQKLDLESVIKMAKRAVKQAKQAEPDPDFVSLPGPQKVPKVQELCDVEIVNMKIEDLIELVKIMIESAKVVKDIVVNGNASCIYGKRIIVNSLGIEVEEEVTGINFSSFCIVRRNDDVGSFYEMDAGRRLKDVNPSEVGKRAGEGALSFLGARKIETKSMPVILNYLPSFSFISSILRALNAESIQRKRSFMIHTLSKQVAPEFLTVYDDGTIRAGLRSSTYDGEGVPKRRILVIEKGIVKTYLHNSYTANKDKVENNACAIRTYSGIPGISPSNIQIERGTWSLNEMIEDVREGIFIKTGYIIPDPITGNISMTIDFGFKIENGELAYPVKGALIGGLVIQWLRNIDAISKEYREEPGNIMPAIRIKNVRIAGAK